MKLLTLIPLLAVISLLLSPFQPLVRAQDQMPGEPHIVYLSLVQRRPLPDPQEELLLAVGRVGALRTGEDCGWEAGVLAWGWVRMWETTGDLTYWNWTRDWVDGCIAANSAMAHVNDVPLAYAALSIYGRDPQSRFWTVVEKAVDFLFVRAGRTADGTLTHVGATVWDDTLMGITPFLVKMWQVTGEERYLDEAVAQVQKHAAHLQDPLTGLFRHAWEEPGNRFPGPHFWARGNGWVLAAQAQLLSAVPLDDARRPALIEGFRRQAAALVALQGDDGLWHTLVTRPDFYTETSGSALISAGLADAARHGWADTAEAAARGGEAIWRQVTGAGIVTGVSGPTAPMEHEDAYAAVPVLDFALYGQGTVLLAGASAAP
jgi:unsaturated rhamnogalacturonyl hydrolase